VAPPGHRRARHGVRAVKILIVDDHQLIREGLRPVLKQLAPPPETAEVLEAADFEAALGLAQDHPDLDLVLLDLNLPGAKGFDGIERLQQRFPAVPVVVVSGEDDPALVRGALDHGALGFIPKSSNSAVILGAIRLVLAGGTYLPREIMAAPRASPSPAPGRDGLDGLGLTPRQADVLRLLLGQVEQAHLPRARPRRGHRQEPPRGDLPGAQRFHPDGSGSRRGQARHQGIGQRS